MEDRQDDRTGTGQAREASGVRSGEIVTWTYSAFAHSQFLFELYSYVAAIPGCCWGIPACGAVIYFVYWRRRDTYIWLKQQLQRWGIIPVNTDVLLQDLSRVWHDFTTPVNRRPCEEDLLSIPPPEENIQRTFVGVLSSETADKLKAMFRRDFCPEIVLLKEGHKLPPECRLVICCLPQNIRKMYLDDGTVFATLITDAGLSQAMVLIIIFGEWETPLETQYDENIYGSVLLQGQNLYTKGHSQREQTRSGVSESVDLVTVGDRPNTYQLSVMKNFIERAFSETIL